MGLIGSSRTTLLAPQPQPGLLASQPVRGGLLGSQGPVRAPTALPPFPAVARLSDQDGGARSVDTLPERSPAIPLSRPAVGPVRPLGGSMRQPFDYEAARKALLPPEPQHSKTHNTIMTILDVLAAMGAGAAGQPYSSPLRAARERADARRYEVDKMLTGWQHGDYVNQNEADLAAAAPFTIGRDRLVYNPATGQTENIYHGPQDWDAYADSLGLKAGTPEYFKAAEDYVLRSAGPTATENFATLDDHRTANDRSLEGFRQGGRMDLERLRQTGASNLEGQRQEGRASLEGQRQEGRLKLRATPSYRDTHGGGTRSAPVPTATDPKTGKRVQFLNGQWVPMK